MKTSKLFLTVIPAQAGIQLIQYHPRSGTAPDFVRCAECWFLLDSRLRGNDEREGG